MTFDPEIPDVEDYGAATDKTEQALAVARQTRDDAMAAIEASRRGVLPLCTDDYIDMKIIHGNAEADVRQLRHNLRFYKHFHWNTLTNKWMREQGTEPARKCSLQQLWRLWRDVEAKRKAYAEAIAIVPQLPGERWANDWGNDKFEVYAGTARQRAETQAAMEEAECIYDAVARTFDGRQPHTWQQMLDGFKVKAPIRPLPSSKNGKRKFVRSTYLGA